MASNSFLANVPRLRGRENYHEWAFAAENLLVLEGMATCIKQENPEATADEAKAKAKLILTIDPSLYVHIKQASSPKDLWHKLKTMFDDSGFSRRITLLRKLISIRLDICDSMTEYVTQIMETAQKLSGTGFHVNDEWMGCLLLAGLSEKYYPMILAIEHSGIAITADVIKTKLIDMVAESDSQAAGNAFFNKGHYRHFNKNKKNDSSCHPAQIVSMTDSKINKNDKSNVKCYRCKQFGHYKSQCKQNNQEQIKKTNVFSAVFLSGNYNKQDFYLDSGASAHMTADINMIKKPSFSPSIREIIVANRSAMPVLCSGDVDIVTVTSSSKYEVTLKDVLGVPGLSTNLISISQLISKGNKVNFKEKCCYIYNRENILVAVAKLINGVYKLIIEQKQCLFTPPSLAAAAISSELWHRRLGHVNSDSLNKMKDAVNGITLQEKVGISKGNCSVCCEGKQSRLPFTNIGTRSTELLSIIHTDICGPMECKSIGGSRYFILFIDDYSRMTAVYFIQNKSEAITCFKEFRVMAEKQTNKSIKIVRSDNGKEFCNIEFDTYLKRIGVIHQTTCPYTPQQNGLSERMNRTIVEKARCLLFDAHLGKEFWAEATNTAVYLCNRTVSSVLKGKTPYELWYGKKPDVSHLRVFGSTVMVHVAKERRTKWDRKAEKYILLGYAENTKGYRLYNPITKRIITNRDVVVMETSLDSDMKHAVVEVNEKQDLEVLNEGEKSMLDPTDDTYMPDGEERSQSSESSSSSEEFYDMLTNDELIDLKPTENSSKEKRVRRQPDRYGYSNVCLTNDNNMGDEYTYDSVMNSSEREQWCKAMEEELQSFRDNEAWELVDKPCDARVVQCKWVYKKKLNSDNSVRYRARLVAKGFTQKEGIDYTETFSPVLKYSTLKLLFAISVNLDLNITHLDVTTAFLNGHLDETVYMQLPQNFKCQYDNCKVLKLKKAIYGLKQSARAWYKKIDNCLHELGYKKSTYEPCLFVKLSGNVKTFIALFVDDFFIFSNCNKEVNYLKSQLSTRFKMKDLGQLRQCLGMNVKIEKDRICIDQKQFIETLLYKFNMENCKNVDTPMEVNLKLEKGENVTGKYPYQQLIGSLMYLSVLTRPDISYCISYLSQFNNCNSETHWKHAKRVLKYLSKTKSLGLMYVKNNSDIVGFVDADWASDIVDRRSYTGYCFILSGCVISHECRKQQTVALSSTEAEYMAVCEASKEAIFLKNMLSELVNRENVPIFLYNDNQSAQKLSENCMYHRRSKHIDVKFHFIRQAVDNRLVRIEYLNTSEMPADLFTKSLCKVKHNKFMQKIGIVQIK